MKKLFKISRVVSICLLFFTGINAIIAGLLFIIDPTGEIMGISITYLSNSPFSNFLIPGITLFVVNGLMNIIVAILTLINYSNFPILIIIQGLLLSGWIVIQVIFVRDFNALHFIMLTIGVVLLILGIILRKQFMLSDA